MVWENESVIGSRWPGQLDIDPHEVDERLHNSGGLSLCRDTPEPLAREANLAGTLHRGSGEGICGIILRTIYVQILLMMTTACSAMEEFQISKSQKFSYHDQDIAFFLGPS